MKRQRESHGHTRGGKFSRTYASWATMHGRCRNPRSTRFALYGARGISVCERWHSFSAFVADMGERPEGLTLDRIDNDGNYEPGNCRWADQKTQSRNRRSNKLDAAKVEEIRQLHVNGESYRKIAARYAITHPMVGFIVRRQVWA